MTDQLSLLDGRGACCVLNVSFPRFRESLDPALWGFDKDSSGMRVKAPTMALLAEFIKPVEQAERLARTIFATWTYSLGLNVGLRFCPLTTLETLCQKVKDAQLAFDTAVDDLLQDFPSKMLILREEWRKYLDEQTDLPEDLRNKVLGAVVVRLPTEAPSRKKFSMAVRWFELSSMGKPSLDDLDALQAERVGQLWKEVERKSADELAAAQRSLVDDCRRELLNRMHQFFTSLNQVVQDGKPVNKRTIDRLSEFVQTVDQLNFMKDAAIGQMLNTIRTECLVHQGRGVQHTSDVADIKSAISGAVDLLSFELKFLTDSSDRALFDQTAKVQHTGSSAEIEI